MNARWWLFSILLIGLGIYVVYGQGLIKPRVEEDVKVEVKEAPKEYPLNKYTFENLIERPRQNVDIVVERVIEEEDEYVSYLISYMSEGAKITGQMNIPEGTVPEDGWPVVVMLRGYVDPEIYETGVGTRSAASYFAENGYVTIAPDFLGYGESDSAGSDVFEDRLRRPVTVLDAIDGILGYKNVDSSRVFLWGHSNGGQIALSVSEIMGESRYWIGVELPVTLWAPVSKPFPYSILYYTDEYEDKGKAIRKVLAEFEEDYDVRKYSIDEYYDWIKVPIQIHQGTADDAVPVEWSSELVDTLELNDVDVTYYEYEGADHNLRPSWDRVVGRDIEYFEEFE